MKKVRKFAHKERGSLLIEMMIAMVVFTVGAVGAMALVMVSTGSNTRSKRDSTSAMLGEMVVNQISAMQVGGSTTSVTVTDCAGNSSTISTLGSATGTGANLSSNAIDYTEAFSSVPAGYAMHYTVCGVVTGAQDVYDVRWNVQTITANKSNFLTVGARLAASGANPRYYALPISIRTVIGNSGN
jgi:Tfp pilus assembly protein PilV